MNQPKIESFVEGHPALLKSVWQRPEGAGCRRVRATRAERAWRGREGAEPPRAQQRAAESRREHLWRYNPELEAEGKNPFQLDSKEPQWDIQDYLKGEVRFASVAKQFPKEADELFAAAQENAQWRYKSYLRMLGTAW